MRQLLLSLLLLTSIPCAALAQRSKLAQQLEQPQPAPGIRADECRIDLTLPAAARVTLDGIDFGAARSIVRPWKMPDGRPLGERSWNVVKVQFPDGGLIQRTVTVQPGCVTRLTLAAPKLELVVVPAPDRDVTSLAFSPDGKRLAAGLDLFGAAVWDVATGHLKSLAPAAACCAVSGESVSVAFRPDGRELLVSPDALGLHLFDIAAGKFVREPPPPTRAPEPAAEDFGQNMIQSADGKLMLSHTRYESQQVVLSDGASWKRLLSVPDPLDIFPKAYGFAADGRQFIIGRSDSTVSIYDTATGNLARTIALDEDLEEVAVAFSPYGRFMVSSARGLWDIEQGKKVGELPSSDKALRFIPDPTLAAFAAQKMQVLTAVENVARLWQYPQVRLLQSFDHGEEIEAIALSPDATRVATGSRAGSIVIWDAATGKKLKILGPSKDSVQSAAFSSDGRRLIVDYADPHCFGWDLSSGQPVAGAEPIATAERSTASADGKLQIDLRYIPPRVADIKSQKTVATLSGVDAFHFLGGFALGGRTVVGAVEHEIVLWDLEGEARKSVLAELDEEPQQLAISPRGDRLAVVLKNEVQLWDLAGRRRLATLYSGRAGEDWLVATPAGFYSNSAGSSWLLEWKLGDAVFPLDRFAANYHRPDEIARLLGGTAPKRAAGR